MKKLSILSIIGLCIVAASCKKEVEPTVKTEEKPVATACYQALYEQDTIDLKINTLKDGSITGSMVMKVFDRPAREGEIEGTFHGDTLLVDYSFKMVTNDKVTFKNPMALLKKGEELVLGNGEIETYLGKSFFKKGVPIDYENVKYKFKKTECDK